jgi:hypothetical protein
MRAKLKTFIKDVIGVRRDRILAKAPMRESERWAKYKVADDQFEKIKDTFRKGGVNFGKWSGPERDRLDDALSIRGRMSQHLQRSRDAVDMANEATRAARKKAAIAAIAVTGGALAIGGASYLATRKGKELSAKLRLRELALGAGTRIRHIPLGERRGIAKKLREAFSEADAPAMAGVPRMIRTGGGDFLLSYRAASQKQRLVFPHSHLGPLADPDAKELRKSKGGRKVAVNNRGHQLAPQDASIGTSTSRSFVDGFNVPYLGVYATPIKQIQSRADAGKLGFPNINAAKAGFNRHYEAEVAQPNGGNIISVRESVGRNEVADDLKSQFSKRGFTSWNRKRVSSRAEEVMIPWGERGARDEFVDGLAKRNNKALSAKLRLRELARGDYAIPALGKMLKDRSFLEEFLTGKRGPKLGDLRHNFNGGITDDRTLAGHIPGLIVGYGLPGRPFVANARQKGRDAIAKMIRKGRAGGDVYEEVNRS